MAASKLGPKARTPGTVGDTADRTAQAKASDLAKLSLDDGFVTIGRKFATTFYFVYGANGIGKTHLLRLVPGMILLPVAKGANGVHVAQWTKTNLDTLEELHDALDHLRFSKHAFTAVGLEDVPTIERLIKIHVEEKLLRESAAYKDDKQKATTIQELNEKEYGAGSTLMAEAWQVLLDKCDALREPGAARPAMAVFLTGPDKVSTVKPLDGEEYQRVEPMIEGQKCAKLLKGHADHVVNLALPIVVTEDNKTRRKTAVQGGRSFRCVQTATLDVKCRGDAPWPITLPFDWDDGWKTFATTERLIATHGAHVVGHFATRGAEAFGQLRAAEVAGAPKTAAERREAAEAAFLAAQGRCDYAALERIVERAEKEVAGYGKAEVGVVAVVPANGAAAHEEAHGFEGRLGAP